MCSFYIIRVKAWLEKGNRVKIKKKGVLSVCCMIFEAIPLVWVIFSIFQISGLII